MDVEPYHADPSLKGKLRRRLVRLKHRRPATRSPDRPMISFSFDDAPRSAFGAGAEVLERHGVRGTFFVCARMAGRSSFVGPLGDREQIEGASAAGHEIACHTYSHLDCGKADEAAVSQNLERNAATLQAWGLQRLETFAYPYGDVGFPAKRLLADRFSLSRALHHGVIDVGTDLAQAPAVGVEGGDGESKALHWMEVARRRTAWLILYTHGVGPEPPPYGCTTDALERLVTRAVSNGFDVVTVADGARRVRATTQ